MEEAITALLANVAGGRRYWVRAPQGSAMPYVVMNRISGFADYTMQRASGYVASRLQMDIYAETYTAALTTARDVKARLSGYRGGVIQGTFLDAERDLPAEDTGSITKLFRVSMDFNIHHNEGN